MKPAPLIPKIALAFLAFAVVSLGACASVPTPTGPGTPVLPTDERATPTSTTAPSPGPTHTVAPIQTPLPTPSYVPPPPADSLRVDGLAKVAVARLRRVVDPDNPSAHPRQNRMYDVLVAGDTVLLTDGPRTIDGREFWQVYDSSSSADFDGTAPPLGWIPAERGGAATLTPFQPECPPTLPTTAAELREVQQSSEFNGLACFGAREIVLRGHLRCYGINSDGVLSAPFFDSQRACELDAVYVYGDPVFDLLPRSGPFTEIEGDYEVRGQFGHPDSAECTWIPFGTNRLSPGSDPDAGAVAACRHVFVITAVQEL